MENQLSREGGLDSHYGEPIIKRGRVVFPLWRTNYQEGECWIPIMENQLSREGGLDSHYGEPIIKRVRAGFPLTDFTQPHVCAYPTPGPRYLRPYVIGFFCVQ
jgi:hypothetical protein